MASSTSGPVLHRGAVWLHVDPEFAPLVVNDKHLARLVRPVPDSGWFFYEPVAHARVLARLEHLNLAPRVQRA